MSNNSFCPKLIIFDLDGTLVEFPMDFLLSEVERILPILEHPPVERSLMEETFSDFDFFRFFPEDSRESLKLELWQEFNWDSFPASVVFPHTLSSLRELASLRMEFAIATSRVEDEQNLRNGLEHTGILEHIETLVMRESHKLDWMNKVPQIEKVLELYQAEPAEALLVGDIPADIISAKQLGVKSAAVLSGGIKRAVLEESKPDYLMEDISELPSLFK